MRLPSGASNWHHIIEGIEIMLHKDIVLAIAFILSVLALFVVIFTDSYLLAMRSEARGYTDLMGAIKATDTLLPGVVDAWKIADTIVTHKRVQQ